MKNTVYAYELHSDNIVAHVKNDITTFEVNIDRQEFENALPKSNGMVDCSFDAEGQNVPLMLTINEYWAQGSDVNDAGIIQHISQYIASNEEMRLRVDKRSAFAALVEKLDEEGMKLFTWYNEAEHNYDIYQLHHLGNLKEEKSHDQDLHPLFQNIIDGFSKPAA